MKMQKAFTNFVLIMFAALIVAGCGGAESRKAKYLEKGKAYMEQQNYDKARIELKNVLQIDPKHAAAYYLIGRVEEERHNWPQAFGSYLKTVELDPDHLDARARLARFYMLSGNIPKAAEMVEAILAKKPEDPDGRLLKAAILAKQGKDNDAIK